MKNKDNHKYIESNQKVKGKESIQIKVLDPSIPCGSVQLNEQYNCFIKQRKYNYNNILLYFLH